MSSPIPISPPSDAPSSHADDSKSASRSVSRKASGLAAPSTPRLSSSPRVPSALGQGTGARRPSSIAPSIPSGVNVDLDELTNEDKAKVLRRHLVSRAERNREDPPLASSPAASTAISQANPEPDNGEPFPVPYDTPGGDVTHPIYKWNSSVAESGRRRTISYAGQETSRDPAFDHIHQPGGFRRNYLLLNDNQTASVHSGDGESQHPPATNNFIEFLYLFGHFAGEELEEIEEEEEPEDELVVDEPSVLEQGEAEGGPTQDLTASYISQLSRRSKGRDMSESTPLMGGASRGMTLKRSMSRHRTRSMSVNRKGDATVSQAVLMMLKAFIGTGVLFLGKAFFNGGLIFSLVTVSVIGLVSLYAFSLLVEVKMKIGGSFGDMGGMVFGTWMRHAILFSIAISQIGFVTAYIIFVSSNLNSLVLSFSKCETQLSSFVLIFGQLILLLPLALIRNLAKLSFTALIADGFILVGLFYIWGSEIGMLVHKGPGDVQVWFNPKDFALLIGTAVFSFEGIGLIIPITDTMKEPHKFPKVLTWVMIFLITLFVASGALSYLAFGSSIQPTVIINLPQQSPATQTVQLIYSLAIMLSIPVQLFPALRIMETAIFNSGISGKISKKIKWEKNGFRAVIVVVCACISWLGSDDLDKFVSFVGCFACIPLGFIYPPLLHFRTCARTRSAKIKDILVFVFGVVTMIFSCVQTIRLAFAPSEPPSGIGACV